MSNWEDLSTYCGFYSPDCKKVRTCTHCGKEYTTYAGQIEYTLDQDSHKRRGLHFCSYNCRENFKKQQDYEETIKRRALFVRNKK